MIDQSPIEQVVARLDSYTQEEHRAHLAAARLRTEARKQARKDHAAAAAARLRGDRPKR